MKWADEEGTPINNLVAKLSKKNSHGKLIGQHDSNSPKSTISSNNKVSHLDDESKNNEIKDNHPQKNNDDSVLDNTAFSEKNVELRLLPTTNQIQDNFGDIFDEKEQYNESK